MDYASRGALTGALSRDRASDALWVSYRWMTLGLATTGVVALGVAHSPALLEALVSNRILFMVLLFAQLGLVMAFSAAAQRVSTGAAAAMFFTYAALTGVTFSTLFLVYAAASIAGDVLHHRGRIRGAVGVRSADPEGISALSAASAVRAHRDDPGVGREHVPPEHGARLAPDGRRRPPVRRADRVRHAEAEAALRGRWHRRQPAAGGRADALSRLREHVPLPAPHLRQPAPRELASQPVLTTAAGDSGTRGPHAPTAGVRTDREVAQ